MQALCVQMQARKDANMFISEIGDILAEGAEVITTFNLVLKSVYNLCSQLSCCHENGPTAPNKARRQRTFGSMHFTYY